MRLDMNPFEIGLLYTLGAIMLGLLFVTVGLTILDMVQDLNRWLLQRAVNRERANRRKSRNQCDA